MDRGGSNHQPLAGDGLAGRERGKGERQASVWGQCQQMCFSLAASRGEEEPTGKKSRRGRVKNKACSRYDSYFRGVEERIDKVYFMDELVKQKVRL